MEICIDFDGTCVTHEFPLVGEDIGAVDVLKELINKGHRLILFTMRCNNTDTKKNYLNDAVNWFKENDIPLYGIQANPMQRDWTTSPKAYGELYIDDAALGCPLIHPEGYGRPYVNWKKVRNLLYEMEIL